MSAKSRMILHKDRQVAMRDGGTRYTTLCGRMNKACTDGMNIASRDSLVSCKHCLRKMKQERTIMKTSGAVALIDLDGTIANYDFSMRRMMRALQHPNELPYEGRVADDVEPDHVKARRKLIQSTPGFWRTLPVIEEGMNVVALMRSIGYELHVLTKGPGSTNSAWTEKKEWCDAHIPDALVTVGSQKDLVYGRVLFDDWPEYFIPWLAVRPRGIVVALPHPWNTDAELERRGMDPELRKRFHRHDPSNISATRVVLQDAFNRVRDAERRS